MSPHRPPQSAAPPTIAALAAAKLLATLPSLGLDANEVCAAAAFDPALCLELDARLPLAALQALWDVAEARAGRADLVLVVAEHYQLGDYGLVGFVAMASPSLGAALAQVARFTRLWTDDPGLHLNDDGRVEVVYSTRAAEWPSQRRANEAALAELLHAARLLTQRRLTPLEVCFKHPAPPGETGGAAFDAFFGVPVRFDQSADWLRFDPVDMARPLPSVDEQLGGYLRRLASDALDSRAEPDTLLSRLREIVADEMQRGMPSIDLVARRLAMSTRTLRRRLEEKSTSFSDFVDETRAEMARAYVRDRRLPLSEIAFLLGFSEPSAFHRAFKRWTQSTPGAWRQRASG